MLSVYVLKLENDHIDNIDVFNVQTYKTFFYETDYSNAVFYPMSFLTIG